jgi:pyridoxal phosphate enzyme (YggS family)
MEPVQDDSVTGRIADNVARIQQQISVAAEAAGRSADEVTLVVVTKTRTPLEIQAAWLAGVRHFGENRVEEAEIKLPALDLEGATWHMVGHVQGRKARRAVGLFDRIDSVDSVRLARRLDRLAAEQEAILHVLIEVNVSGEASKYGLGLSDRAALDAAVAEIVSLPNLAVDGLMTVAFIAQDAEAVRPVFAGLRTLRDELRALFPQASWRHLSMGMSGDFDVAVQEGATMVRIGRAVFE